MPTAPLRTLFVGCAAFVVILPVAETVAQTNPSTTTRATSRPGRPPRAATRPADPADVAKLATLGRRDVVVHDPSTIVRCKDEYWFFGTGRGVPSWRSKDLRTWERGPDIFSAAPPWVAEAVPGNRELHYWAPDVIRSGDRYLVYYSVSTFGRNTSAIALASNPTLDPKDPSFRWTDEGIVVRSSRESNHNTIDAGVYHDAQGKLWLSFGSFWSGIKLIELDPRTGKRVAEDSPMHSIAHTNEIEAPFVYAHGGQYYLFVNWGICCRGINSTYNIRVGRSQSPSGPFLDREGNDLAKGGGTPVLASDGPFIGPGHAGIVVDAEGREWFSCHFYDATENGRPTLSIRPLTWDAERWPVVGKTER